MELKSSAFENDGFIPQKYTCDGENISPPLRIDAVPQESQSLALLLDDPDAPLGTFTHWLSWNISPEVKEIPEKSEPEGVAGRTDFGRMGYGGPCPPSGVHTYRFKLYALNKKLDLKAGADKSQFAAAIKGCIIEEAILRGKYKRH